jgi:hypothetical protein
MWLLFDGKSQFKQIPDGRQVERHCDDCGRHTTFVECDITDTLRVWFVDALSNTQRRFVCRECGEDVALDEVPAPAAQLRRTAAPAPAVTAQATEREKDEMLAALKRKMGLSNPK